jgi:hypothetical protein
MQVNIEQDASQIFGGEVKCGPRKIDSSVVADRGINQGFPHLSGIAARDIEKINWIANRRERSVQCFFDVSMGKGVVVDDLLIGRPAFLELDKRRLVIDASGAIRVMEVNAHETTILTCERLRQPVATHW